MVETGICSTWLRMETQRASTLTGVTPVNYESRWRSCAPNPTPSPSERHHLHGGQGDHPGEGGVGDANGA